MFRFGIFANSDVGTVVACLPNDAKVKGSRLVTCSLVLAKNIKTCLLLATLSKCLTPRFSQKESITAQSAQSLA